MLVFGHVQGFSGGLLSRYSQDGQLLASVSYLDGQPIPDNDPLFYLSYTHTEAFGTPAKVGNTFYAGLSSGGSPIIAHSNDGIHWKSLASSRLPILPETLPAGVTNTRKFSNLASSPSGDQLWGLIDNKTIHKGAIGGFSGISLDLVELKSELWGSQDHGKNWVRIDNGSFPRDVNRIVNNTITGVSYALGRGGLFVSKDNGQSWRSTGLKNPVYELQIIPEILVASTSAGIAISEHHINNWKIMSAGLFPIPHTVQYSQKTLIAASAAGYFVCPERNCFGPPFPIKRSTNIHTNVAPRTIPAIEFYNRTFDHYFLTTNTIEIQGIDEGSAGLGWERTGHSFKVWPKLGAPTGMHVCRFYGSVNPGPNSHFFSISPAECSRLLELQNNTPEGKPRWHLENYAFMAVPPQADSTCPDQYQPVYRTYNNGFNQDKDSNHRFVTDRTLLEPLLAKGWIDEGIGFCVPE